MPGRPTFDPVRFGAGRPGEAASTTSGKATLVVFLVLGGSVRGTRSPSLTSFLPLTSHARVILWRKRVCAPKALEKQTDREIAKKGI